MAFTITSGLSRNCFCVKPASRTAIRKLCAITGMRSTASPANALLTRSILSPIFLFSCTVLYQIFAWQIRYHTEFFGVS